jgi:hypothetical protein
MRSLNASGRKPEALHAFRDYESRLAEETGLEPSVAIRELELSILVGVRRCSYDLPPGVCEEGRGGRDRGALPAW